MSRALKRHRAAHRGCDALVALVVAQAQRLRDRRHLLSERRHQLPAPAGHLRWDSTSGSICFLRAMERMCAVDVKLKVITCRLCAAAAHARGCYAAGHIRRYQSGRLGETLRLKKCRR